MPTFELDGLIRTFPSARASISSSASAWPSSSPGFAEVAAMPDVSSRLGFVAKNVAEIMREALGEIDPVGLRRRRLRSGRARGARSPDLSPPSYHPPLQGQHPPSLLGSAG
jgi:hypothetical protein